MKDPDAEKSTAESHLCVKSRQWDSRVVTMDWTVLHMRGLWYKSTDFSVKTQKL